MAVTPPSVAAPNRLLWLRLAMWGGVALVGVVAAVLVVVLGHRNGSSAVDMTPPASDVPAATWAPGAVRAPDIRLADENGKPVTLAAFRGRPVLVTFIDPLCRNFCPLEARRLSAAVRSFPAASRPAIVAVSVNVYGNARANLVQDRGKWNLLPQWHWGIGSDAELASVWKRYHVAVLVQTKTIAGVTVHDVAHTEAAYLIDASGHERALFLWPYRAAAVTQALQGLMPATP